ncbi:hypothetical protein GCM10009846_29220 [Agrococcus versicolor]|uniref:WGR domain-containing protein n=1 Tax=Agrococcus versicolor TaxID=501482 RepID=A0ABP5MTH8_9MICO
MPELSVEPSEWVVMVHRRAYAVIRRVTIAGDDGFWRVVTGEDDRSRRRLIGYWGSLEEAAHNALAYVEHRLPSAWMATGTSTSVVPRAATPQRPLPGRSPGEPGIGPGTIPRGLDTVWGPSRRDRRAQR